MEVTYEGAAIGPSFIRVRLKPKLGVKVSSLLRLSDDLQVQLGISVPPMIAPQAGFVSVDLPRTPAQIALFEQYLKPKSLPVTAPVRVAIGVNLENKLVEADLSDPNTCHFLVGGTTGSGKSEFLRALLLSLTQRRSPDHLKLALVDPKRVTFPEFENIPWLLSPIVKDSDRAIALMEDLVLEMESRYKAFEANRCNDLPTYNQQCLERNQPTKPPIICLFDEYADFMAEKEVAKVLELSIKRLGGHGPGRRNPSHHRHPAARSQSRHALNSVQPSRPHCPQNRQRSRLQHHPRRQTGPGPKPPRQRRSPLLRRLQTPTATKPVCP